MDSGQDDTNTLMNYCWSRVGLQTLHKRTHVQKPEISKNGMNNEYIFKTLVIKTVNDMKKLIHLIREEGVTEVGLNMYGTLSGRTGEVGWVCLFLQGTIVTLDVVALVKLEKLQTFWYLLGLYILENEAIQKVIFNSVPIADYLLHAKDIRLRNVFDIQLSAFHNSIPGRAPQGCPAQRRLSDCLRNVLSEEVPAEELNLLQEFEMHGSAPGFAFMERPINNENKKFYKCAAIQMKYLLRLKWTLMEVESSLPSPFNGRMIKINGYGD